MKHRAILLCTALAAGASCSPEAPGRSSDGAWVGSVTTEGTVTTVVNESGSVWSGPATLVEEASIGVDAGEEPYLLGRVAGIAVHGDRIYVLDQQVPALRVYGLDGRHVTDVGGPGGGTGEFEDPGSVAVAPDGRLFVRDARQGRINVYGPGGESLATWSISSSYFTGRPMVVTSEGTLYTPVSTGRIFAADRRIGLQGFRPDGSLTDVIPEPEFGFERPRVIVRRGGGISSLPVPFAPAPAWTLAPSGALVSGVGDEYRYEVRHADGSTMIVERRFDRLPVDPDEAEAYADGLRERVERVRRGEGTVEGADPGAIPQLRPAFRDLIAGHGGSVWVVRDGPGRYLPSCSGDPGDDPCWERTQVVDVFDPEGRFLGEVDLPEGVRVYPQPYIEGDVVVAAFQDEAGTPMVKRYRLAPPGM